MYLPENMSTTSIDNTKKKQPKRLSKSSQNNVFTWITTAVCITQLLTLSVTFVKFEAGTPILHSVSYRLQNSDYFPIVLTFTVLYQSWLVLIYVYYDAVEIDDYTFFFTISIYELLAITGWCMVLVFKYSMTIHLIGAGIFVGAIAIIYLHIFYFHNHYLYLYYITYIIALAFILVFLVETMKDPEGTSHTGYEWLAFCIYSTCNIFFCYDVCANF